MPGPVPKRSDVRRRRNKADEPQKAPSGVVAQPGACPEPDPAWHPIAAGWFIALGESGQAVFYEPSDWATARLIAESMSRDLQPQVVGVIQDGKDAGLVVKEVIPLKGASLTAYLRAMSVLLVTEGDRRRMRLELQRGEAPPAPPSVALMENYRRAAGRKQA
jgi:hypothetical protein